MKALADGSSPVLLKRITSRNPCRQSPRNPRKSPPKWKPASSAWTQALAGKHVGRLLRNVNINVHQRQNANQQKYEAENNASKPQSASSPPPSA